MRKNISYRLGIDLGTNSLGFALVELKDDMPLRPIDMGVRIFSDGRDSKTKASLAVQRRNARGMRRRRDRIVRRKQQLIDMFIEKGLFPKNKEERKKLELIDPYEIRTKGLNEKLSPYELGRALFHINQRRGFQSNRKQAADNEEGKIKLAINKLENELEKNDCKTVGEYFHKRKEAGKSVRIRSNLDKSTTEKDESPYDFYTKRDMLKKEYELLLGCVNKVFAIRMRRLQT